MQASTVGKKENGQRVERSLYQRAVGYHYDAVRSSYRRNDKAGVVPQVVRSGKSLILLMPPTSAACLGSVRPIFYVRRAKARFPWGPDPPGNFHSPGSNRSSRGGDETAEAFGVEGHLGGRSPCARGPPPIPRRSRWVHVSPTSQ